MTEHTPTARPDQQPALELSVNPSGKVRVTVEYDPWTDRPVPAELTALCRQASSIVRMGAGAASAGQERAAVRDQEFAERRRLTRRIGRLASCSVRKNRANLPSQRDVTQAHKEFGAQYGMKAEAIGVLARLHNGERDKRYRRMRDRVVARFYSEGCSYEQIGGRFGVSAKTAAKWSRNAAGNIGTSYGKTVSDTGNPHREAV